MLKSMGFLASSFFLEKISDTLILVFRNPLVSIFKWISIGLFFDSFVFKIVDGLSTGMKKMKKKKSLFIIFQDIIYRVIFRCFFLVGEKYLTHICKKLEYTTQKILQSKIIIKIGYYSVFFFFLFISCDIYGIFVHGLDIYKR